MSVEVCTFRTLQNRDHLQTPDFRMFRQPVRLGVSEKHAAWIQTCHVFSDETVIFSLLSQQAGF
jgi:hypothetical protein